MELSISQQGLYSYVYALNDPAHSDCSFSVASIESPADVLVTAAIQSRISFYEAMSSSERRFDPCLRAIAMDRELLTIDKVLSDFRRHRNSLISASACPPEVLSSIFRILAHMEPNYYPDPKDYLDVVTRKQGPRLGWIKVTQVCHSWRVAACTNSFLWATVTTSLGMDYAMQMLRLSKNSALSLDLPIIRSNPCGNAEPDSQALLSIVDDHVERISRLQILTGGVDRRWLLDLCKKPAPQLQSLFVFARRGPCTLASDVFAGSTPSLKELHLHNVTFPLHTLHGSAITRLTITAESRAYRHVNLGRFVEVLSHLSDLESLCIKNQWSNETLPVLPPDQTAWVKCPRLIDIILHSRYANTVMSLYTRLSHHPDAKVDLAGDYTSRILEPQDDQVLESFREHMEGLPICATIRTVEWRSFGAPRTPIPEQRDRVDIAHEKTLVLSAWRENNPEFLLADYEGYDAPPRPDFMLTLGCEAFTSSEKDPEDILPWPELFSSARNVSLQTSKRYPFTVMDWNDVFENLSHLEFFRVDRELAEEFLRDGKRWLADEMTTSLRALALLGVFFGCTEGEDSPDRCLAHICRTLRDRGGALEEVILSELVLEDSDLDPRVRETGVVMRPVYRPSWLCEGHEDYDDRTRW